jgi:hypothetical protein
MKDLESMTYELSMGEFRIAGNGCEAVASRSGELGSSPKEKLETSLLDLQNVSGFLRRKRMLSDGCSLIPIALPTEFSKTRFNSTYAL